MKRLIFSIAIALAAAPGCTCARTKERADDVDAAKTKPITIDEPADLTLPRSKSKEVVPTEGILVFVSRTAIAAGKFGEAPTHVLALGDRATLVREGVDAHAKEGANSVYVVPLGDRITALRKELGVSTLTPVIVSIDASTPFHVFSEIVGTIQRLQSLRYDLVVRGDGDARAIVPLGLADLGALSNAPKTTPDAGPDAARPTDAPVDFGVRVHADGFSIRAFGEELGTGCTTGGSGTTIPKGPAGYDLIALHACAEREKALVPDTRDALVTITSTNEIDVQTLVDMLDALRTSASGATLFPHATFAVVH